MKKGSLYVGLFALAIVLTSFISSTPVKAATGDVEGRTYNTWMQTNDNDLFTAKERYFLAGTNTIDLSFDYWNSSICKTSSDSSLVTINLFDNPGQRTVAYKTLGTRLYTCNRANFGSFKTSYYIYYFLTFDSNQHKYCGYHSNSVIMKSS